MPALLLVAELVQLLVGKTQHIDKCVLILVMIMNSDILNILLSDFSMENAKCTKYIYSFYRHVSSSLQFVLSPRNIILMSYESQNKAAQKIIKLLAMIRSYKVTCNHVHNILSNSHIFRC